MTALDFSFPLMTPPIGAEPAPLRLSIRPPWSIDAREALRAVEDELAYRRTAYPGFVRKLSMSAEEAAHHLQLLAACAADLRGTPPAIAEPSDDPPPCWRDKVQELRREIDLRRRLYPRRIAAHRLGEEEARRQMEGMEAAHWRFWIALEGWTQLGIGPALTDRLQPVREQAALVDLWERAARAAGDPAARPLDLFTTPPDWKEAA